MKAKKYKGTGKKDGIVLAMQVGKKRIEDLQGFLVKECKNASIYEYAERVEVIFREPKFDVIAKNGDWVIKDKNGKFYPCRKDTFKKMYKEVTKE